MPDPADSPFPYRAKLDLPVIGMESEFTPIVNGEEVVPEDLWRHPSAFIDTPMLKRTSKSSQLPGGGAIYFDGGVIELVTPVIEIAPQCTSRMVRNLWEQITFLRSQLDRWESKTGQHIQLRGFSSHYNIAFEIPRLQRSRHRTIQKLALLLATVLPVPVIVAAANRRSTGVGVRPRRDRIEITMDFTPDPGMTLASAALIVGIAREIISWNSYRVEELIERGIPLLVGVEPGRHATRKGWLTRDYHYPQSPFTSDADAPVWRVQDGSVLSLRQIALASASPFRTSIESHADTFSTNLLFSIFRGETPSLLDLPDRPDAYDDVGRATKWGSVLPQLENYGELMERASNDQAIEDHLQKRDEARRRFASSGQEDEDGISAARRAKPHRRATDILEVLDPPWTMDDLERRRPNVSRAFAEKRSSDRRSMQPSLLTRSPLTRSRYEQLFSDIATGAPIRIGPDLFRPVAMRGWYHAIVRRDSDGEERIISIDQLVETMEKSSS